MANQEDYFSERITTAVAIDRDKNSQFAVKWAVDNLKLTDKQIILVHVGTQNNFLTQIGGLGVSRAPAQNELQKLFLPYRGFCARKGIRAKEVVLHDLDIAIALSEYINANSILTIVLGASSRGAIARAFRNADVPTCVGRSVHDSCTVYVVSKGRSQKIKSPSEPVTPNGENVFSPDASSVSPQFRGQVSLKNGGSEVSSLEGSDTQERGSPDTHNESMHIYPWEKRHISNNTTPMESASSSIDYTPYTSHYNSPEYSGQVDNEYGHVRPVNKPPGSKILRHNNDLNFRVGVMDLLPHSGSGSGSSVYSEVPSYHSDFSYDLLDLPQVSDSSRSSTSSQTAEIEEELRRMKIELKQISEMYNIACREAVTAREKVRDIVQWKSEEATRLEDRKQAQEAALAIVEREKQKCKAAVEITQRAQRIAELESEKRKRAEMKFKHDTEEKQKVMDALSRSVVRYRKYSMDEIGAATNYFSTAEKIGEGGYGPVFKATLDHTPVAIKVLRSDISEGQKQFQREVEVLSRMRHPNMVILLGACPESGCLVYEYMENGCLEDRLYCKDDTPPLSWTARFRISAEIATALSFLHNTRPEPLVHRDLKPANILLDKNYVSKISDVGLSRLVPPYVADSVTQYHMTAAAGTFCYIDPEYQQTGMLGTKSDIYSLGVMLLQIITGKPPMGLTHQVESAIEKDRFGEILDPTVDDWPVEEALSFAKLALKCCELRRRDRPDLDSVILPELERLRDIGLQVKPEGFFYYMYSQGHSFQESSSSSQENRSKNAWGSGSSSTVTTLENMD